MSTISYTLPKNAAELKKINDGAIAKASSMRIVVQQAAVANLHHAYMHGDYTGANYLVEGLGHGVKRDSLITFFATVGGLIIDEADPSKGFTGWKGKAFIKENFDLAKSKHWYEYKKANDVFAGYNFEEEVKKFINKASKQRAKAAKIEDVAERQQYNFSLSDSVMSQLLELANFEVVEAGSEDLGEELVSELKRAVA